MNQSEIYALAKGAGLPDDKAKIAAAIAMAESGGNPNAIADDSDDLSYGLWQINMIGSLGPARRAQFGLKSNADLLVPATNAKVMSEISKQGQNFKPWTTYTSKKYEKYMGIGLGDLLDPHGLGEKIGAQNETIAAAATATQALVRTAAWVSDSKNWQRIAFVILGGVIVIAGISAMARPYVDQAAGKAASLMNTGAKVSKIAKKAGGK